MKNKKEPFQPYDPSISPEEIEGFVNDATKKLGDAVRPNNDKVFKEWDNLCQALKFSSARTVARLVDAKNFQSIRSYGQRLLGYSEYKQFTAADMINMTHPNQSKLLAYQTSNIIGLMMQHPELVPSGSVYYVSRSLLTKDKKKCWLVHQNTKPIQFDVNGRMTKFISTYTLLGEYQGEPLITEVVLPEGYNEEKRTVGFWLEQFKADILENLGFNRNQEDIIKQMSIGASTSDLCKYFKCKKGNIGKHRENTLKKAREIFPMNNFSTCMQVVNYLKQQGII